MLEQILSVLASFKKIAPVPLLAIAFASVLFLACPTTWAEALGIEGFRTDYRAWLGASLILSVSYLGAHLLWWLRGTYFERRKHRRLKAARRRHLHTLTPEEKGYLLPYIRDNVASQKFLLEDGVAGGLQGKHIIYLSAQIGDMVNGFSFNIQPWAREYLQEHPELLEGAELPPPRNRFDRW